MVLDIVFSVVAFVKGFVLGGDMYFDGCCIHGCF
jgi:hypothetical protein